MRLTFLFGLVLVTGCPRDFLQERIFNREQKKSGNYNKR